MTNDLAKQGLKTYLQRWLTDDDIHWPTFLESVRVLSVAKNERLLTANETQGVFWYIAQGLVRNFYTTEQGKEFNKSFIPAPGFCGAMSELILSQPSRFSIAALEPTVAVAIPAQWLRDSKKSSPAVQALALTIAEQMALKKEQREAELLLDDATTRYQNFMATNPQLANRLPAYHIASYLGMTEVALSRIKRQLEKTDR